MNNPFTRLRDFITADLPEELREDQSTSGLNLLLSVPSFVFTCYNDYNDSNGDDPFFEEPLFLPSSRRDAEGRVNRGNGYPNTSSLIGMDLNGGPSTAENFDLYYRHLNRLNRPTTNRTNGSVSSNFDSNSSRTPLRQGLEGNTRTMQEPAGWLPVHDHESSNSDLYGRLVGALTELPMPGYLNHLRQDEVIPRRLSQGWLQGPAQQPGLNQAQARGPEQRSAQSHEDELEHDGTDSQVSSSLPDYLTIEDVAVSPAARDRVIEFPNSVWEQPEYTPDHDQDREEGEDQTGSQVRTYQASQDVTSNVDESDNPHDDETGLWNPSNQDSSTLPESFTLEDVYAHCAQTGDIFLPPPLAWGFDPILFGQAPMEERVDSSALAFQHAYYQGGQSLSFPIVAQAEDDEQETGDEGSSEEGEKHGQDLKRSSTDLHASQDVASHPMPSLCSGSLLSSVASTSSDEMVPFPGLPSDVAQAAQHEAFASPKSSGGRDSVPSLCCDSPKSSTSSACFSDLMPFPGLQSEVPELPPHAASTGLAESAPASSVVSYSSRSVRSPAVSMSPPHFIASLRLNRGTGMQISSHSTSFIASPGQVSLSSARLDGSLVQSEPRQPSRELRSTTVFQEAAGETVLKCVGTDSETEEADDLVTEIRQGRNGRQSVPSRLDSMTATEGGVLHSPARSQPPRGLGGVSHLSERSLSQASAASSRPQGIQMQRISVPGSEMSMPDLVSDSADEDDDLMLITHAPVRAPTVRLPSVSLQPRLQRARLSSLPDWSTRTSGGPEPASLLTQTNSSSRADQVTAGRYWPVDMSSQLANPLTQVNNAPRAQQVTPMRYWPVDESDAPVRLETRPQAGRDRSVGSNVRLQTPLEAYAGALDYAQHTRNRTVGLAETMENGEGNPGMEGRANWRESIIAGQDVVDRLIGATAQNDHQTEDRAVSSRSSSFLQSVTNPMEQATSRFLNIIRSISAWHRGRNASAINHGQNTSSPMQATTSAFPDPSSSSSLTYMPPSESDSQRSGSTTVTFRSLPRSSSLPAFIPSFEPAASWSSTVNRQDMPCYDPAVNRILMVPENLVLSMPGKAALADYAYSWSILVSLPGIDIKHPALLYTHAKLTQGRHLA